MPMKAAELYKQLIASAGEDVTRDGLPVSEISGGTPSSWAKRSACSPPTRPTPAS